MKKFALLILNLLLFSLLLADPVDQQTALKVAKNFFSAVKGEKNITFDYVNHLTYDGQTAIYIFGQKNGGFVLVAGDDNVRPLLAYSSNSKFPWPIQSPDVKWWLNGMAHDIIAAAHAKKINPNVKKQWQQLLSGQIKYNPAKATYLLDATWNQTGGDETYPFNYFCPKGTPVGCVATAAAQIVYYWKYPSQGRTWHSYQHDMYGRMLAMYDTTHYNWNAMYPDRSSFYAALLSYQLGVAVNMDYSFSGSGAYTHSLTYALPNFFGYSHDIMFYHRSYIEENFGGEQAWKDTLINQVNKGWPVEYAGFGSGGHAFVLDGYDPATDMFHFNWGWGGSYNGFYSIDKLNPGNSDFSKSQSAVINIHPPANTPGFSAVPTETAKGIGYVRYIFATSRNVAYAVPENRDAKQNNEILKSTTAGAIWKIIKLSNYPNYGVSMVYAINPDTLFVPIFSQGIGNTYLLKSTDGGKTWKQVLAGKEAGTSFFNIVHFFDSKHGIVMGDPVNGKFEIYTTDDGGNTWNAVDPQNIPDALKDEYGTVGYYYGNSKFIMFFTTKGRVYRSLDLGHTWQEDTLVVPNPTIDPEGNDRTSISGAMNNLGIGVINELYIKNTPTDTTYIHYYFYTNDTGRTWTQFTPNGPMYDGQITVAPGTNRFYSVGSGISYSNDGKNWIDKQKYFHLFYFNTISFPPDRSNALLGSYQYSLNASTWIMGPNNVAVPVISANPSKRSCVNTNITFTSQSFGSVVPDSTFWDFGQDANPPTAVGQGPISVSYSSPGVKTIKLVVYNGQGQQFYASSTYKIDGSKPNPVDSLIGDKYPMLNKSYTYSVPEQDAKYKWTLPDEWKILANNDTSFVRVKVAGIAGPQTITVQPYNGCGQAQSTDFQVIVVTGSKYAYPNPATSYLNIEDVKGAQIYIYNSNGVLVQKINSNQYLQQINIADPRYTNGLYYIRIIQPDGSKRQLKIIVLKAK